MPLRFSNEEDFNVWLRFQADTAEAEKRTQRLGQTVNEVNTDQFQQIMTQQQGMINSAKELEKQTALIQRNWWRTQRVLRASALIFRNITLLGTAIWAPLIAGAVKYVKEVSKLEDVTDPLVDAWTLQSRGLEQAQRRIGRTTVQVLLPYLEKVNVLASKAAGVIERHPDIIEAALKTGVAVTTVGVLGTLVTQGVKMVVDIKFVAASANQLLAARIMERASEKQLAAATGQKVTSTATAAGATGILGSLGAPGILGIGAGLAGVVGSFKLSSFLREQGFGNILANFAPLLGLAGPIVGIGANAERVASEVGTLVDKLQELTKGASKGTAAVANFTVDLERLEKEGEGARIILELQRSLAETSKKYEKDRVDIIRESAARAEDIQKRYSDRITKAWEHMNQRIEEITRDYNKQAGRDEEDYRIQRAEILKDARQSQIDDEKRFQEKLRQLRLDHEDRVDELVRARDALGLVKEERRYQRERDEAIREQQQRTQKMRLETRERLVELDRRHALERRRRYEDYVQRVQDERDRFEQEKDEAAEQRANELKELRKAQEEKLAELKRAYEEEKRDAVNAAYEKIVLLRGAYDAELSLRQQYQGLILQSTKQFLDEMLDTFTLTMGDLKTEAPSRQMGGYSAGTRLHRLHANEYVLNPGMVQIAEQALGGSLNNQRLASFFNKGGTTLNVQLPGGLVTIKMLKDILRNDRTQFLNEFERMLSL